MLKTRHTINSLQFSFVFIDDGDTVVYTTGPSFASASSSQTLKPDAKTSIETSERTVTTPRYGVGERESVKLSFDGASFTGATAAVYSSSTIPTATSSPSQVQYVRSTTGASCTATQWLKGQVNCQQITRTAVTHYETAISSTDYTGQIALEGSLMSYNALMAGLVKNGKLDFNIQAMGDIDLASATLDMDIDILGSDVPEPASGALVGIALLGMAGVRGKNRA
ncbi:PEP-CTERM sorting domain-containing protein [Massilia yuzhufengensis]|uniref:PEP-CTERM sorting domain-containing protein n=1 Tax=Massilia yuzhufengensis TaxID=1164594 RepID=UPI000B8849EF|nr:PEP-CTERM sorting domain-containing protein [Massilia yuzhufengensis]